jgi:2-methylcitrate dehydratase PrpD
MAATQALTEILAAGVPPGAITRVKAFVPPAHHRMVDHGVAIGDRSSFLTSLPYRLAVAALDPRAAFAAVQAPQEVAENIAAFMARVEVAPIAPDDVLMADFPRQWPARVEVTTPAGRHARVVTHMPGDPQRPYDAAAVQEKFHRFAAPAVGAEAAARILQRALGLLTGQTPAAALMRDVEKIAGRIAQRE